LTHGTRFLASIVALLAMQPAQSSADECPQAEYNYRATVSSSDNALDLSGMSLSAIPKRVFEMTNLEELDLSKNNLTVLPKDLLKLTKPYVTAIRYDPVTPSEIGIQATEEWMLASNNKRNFVHAQIEQALSKLGLRTAHYCYILASEDCVRSGSFAWAK
jgi:hypothetical protein